jgi:molybdate transport system ATP-binding protein
VSLQVDIGHSFGSFALEARFIAPGEGVTALFGASGSGKSSVVNAIAGLFRPRRARIALNGAALVDTDERVFIPSRKRKVGYVFQDTRLFPHMSVQSNLLYGWRRAGKPLGEAEIAQILDMLGIARLLERRPAALSGGERQRVALGRALLAKPAILLLDEPLAALDQARKAEILPYLERLRAEARSPIVYVSHSTEEVARLADYVVMLDQGHVAASGGIIEMAPRLNGANAPVSVIEARIERHLADEGLSLLSAGGAEVFAPLIERPTAVAVRLRIASEDVMIALSQPPIVSALNVFPATVMHVETDALYANVRLRFSGGDIISRVTNSSARRLGLATGARVYAILKAVNILV